jgi:hypothetical protein
MAEIIGIVSGIAGLVTLAAQITKLSYGFMLDIKNASRTQKQYLREVSALTEALLGAEQASQDAETLGLVIKRPNPLSESVIADCRTELASLLSDLEKHSHRLLWSLLEQDLRKRIDELQRFRSVFQSFITANIL